MVYFRRHRVAKKLVSLSSYPLVDRKRPLPILIESDFTLSHFNQLKVRCTLRIPEGNGIVTPVVVAHGFLGFKDWGFFPYLGRRLSEAGFAAITFNHALSGIRDNPWKIDDPEGFSRNTTTQELRDWDLVMDALLLGNVPLADRMRLNAVGVIGHSRGGSYAILLSRRMSQIASIVTWGAIRTFDRFDTETRRRWRNQGYLEVPREEQETPLRMDVAALEALERNDRRLEIPGAVRKSAIPILFLHGRQDRRVPLSEGEGLWQCADPRLCRFHVIEDAGHTFQTRHPLTTPSLPLLEAVSKTVGWFRNTLPP